MILKFSCEVQVREKLGKYEWCNNKTSHTSLNLLHSCEEKNTRSNQCKISGKWHPHIDSPNPTFWFTFILMAEDRIFFSNTLMIYEVKVKEFTTVKVVWISDTSYH